MSEYHISPKAEIERELIVKRTKAGLAAARVRGSFQAATLY